MGFNQPVTVHHENILTLSFFCYFLQEMKCIFSVCLYGVQSSLNRHYLILSQTTDLKLFQIETVCRRQF